MKHLLFYGIISLAFFTSQLALLFIQSRVIKVKHLVTVTITSLLFPLTTIYTIARAVLVLYYATKDKVIYDGRKKTRVN